MQDGERTVTLRRVGNSKFLGMMFHTVRGAHPDSVAADVLGDILTLAPSGRLYKSLVETKKATIGRRVGVARSDPGTITFFAQMPDGQPIEPAREAMLATIENIAKEPITEARSRARARARPPSTTTTCSTSAAVRRGASPNPSRSATGGCSSSSATAIAR